MLDEFERSFEGTTERRSFLRIVYIIGIIVVCDLHARWCQMMKW